MLDKDIQDALSKLDNSAKKSSFQRYGLAAVLGVALMLCMVGGYAFYKQAVPEISEKQLSQMIVVAARTSDNDPLRLLGEVERHIGKRLSDFSIIERADALTYLMDHIDLHKSKEALIYY